jgi:hypothetical protein
VSHTGEAWRLEQLWSIHEATIGARADLFLLVDGLLLRVLSGMCDNCREMFVTPHSRRARIANSMTA